MSKNKLFIVACLALIYAVAHAVKFEFHVGGDLPTIEIKVTTQNKKSDTRKIGAGNKGPVTIEVLGGDEIAVLSIMTQCKEKKIYCEELDEIYIGYPKPAELKAREKNISERGTYLEKIRRYDEPRLRGKTKFTITKGFGVVGFFQVDAAH